MDLEKVLGIIISISLIFIIAFILTCCLGFHKISQNKGVKVQVISV